MTNFKKSIITLLLVLPLVSGCSAFTWYKNWSDTLGSKLPTRGDRCEGQWFCFGDDKPSRPAVRSSSNQRRPVSGNQQGSIPSYGQVPPSNDRYYAPPPSRNVAPPRAAPQRSPYDGYSSAPPSAGAYQPPAQPRRLPRSVEELYRYNKENPSIYEGGGPPRTAARSNEPRGFFEKEDLSDDPRLKPWEANPEWKRDLPPSPIDEIKRGIGW